MGFPQRCGGVAEYGVTSRGGEGDDFDLQPAGEASTGLEGSWDRFEAVERIEVGVRAQPGRPVSERLREQSARLARVILRREVTEQHLCHLDRLLERGRGSGPRSVGAVGV